MGIHRLNHAVLYVSDLARSVAFYRDVLGFRPVAMTPDGFRGATFLQAPDSTNDHDLGLFEIGAGAGRSTAGRATVGLYHLAWEVDTLDELAATAERLAAAGALAGTSDHGTHQEPLRQGPGRAGVRGGLADPGRPARRQPRWPPASRSVGSTWTAERQRYGGQTRGGVGISVPA